MGKTMAERLLARAAGLDDVSAGEIVTATVDVVMMDDALGPTFINKEFTRLGEKFADKSRVVLISDHLTPASNVDQSEMLAQARRFAQRHEIAYYEGCGPCHQVLAEKCYDLPGTLLVGTDSHTVTAGAFGCFGTGIGSTEAIGVLMSGSLWLRVPESIEIVWEGELPRGLMAKDLILRTIKDIGHAGATYQAMELKGSTIQSLSMDERMCISNMTVEAGAKVGLIAADEKTDAYLQAHGNTRAYQKIDSDRMPTIAPAFPALQASWFHR